MSYAIGVAEPLSITVFDYGTSDRSPEELLAVVHKNFDLRPGKIVRFAVFILKVYLLSIKINYFLGN